MRPKILIIVENSTYPIDTRVRSEAQSLNKNGYDVIVLCPQSKKFNKIYEIIDGIHIYRHPAYGSANSIIGHLLEYSCAFLGEFLFTLWIYIRHRFKVIQGCNPPDNIVLIAIPFKLLGVKYIFDHHDANPELFASKYGGKGFFYKAICWLEKLTYRFSDIVIATNESYKKLAISRGGKNPEDVYVVRNGPDLKKFLRLPANDALKYNKKYLIGYVGVMAYQDGLDILLEVVKHIKKLGRKDIHFTCVGKGPALDELRQLIEEMDLRDMVNFTGFIPDNQMIEILSTADVCVNPDRPCEMNNISTMIKIMEYMALGKPIVQFDLKEGRYSAQDASLYADTHNMIHDFAEKILWLLDNPSERKKMGNSGRTRIENGLAWDYSVTPLLAAYEKAINKK